MATTGATGAPEPKEEAITEKKEEPKAEKKEGAVPLLQPQISASEATKVSAAISKAKTRICVPDEFFMSQRDFIMAIILFMVLFVGVGVFCILLAIFRRTSLKELDFWILLLVGSFLFIVGIVLIIYSSVKYSQTKSAEKSRITVAQTVS